jgi:hypothetical protein
MQARLASNRTRSPVQNLARTRMASPFRVEAASAAMLLTWRSKKEHRG